MLINLADFWRRRDEGTWVRCSPSAWCCFRRQRGRPVIESLEVPLGEGAVGPR